MTPPAERAGGAAGRIVLHPFAWIAALVPPVTVHLCLLLAMTAGAFPACYPVLDGCASISATGRAEPAVYLFKPVFTVHAVLLALLWTGCARWLVLLGERPAVANRMAVAGVAAAAALIVYVTFLGSDTAAYAFMRRFGIYGFFVGTVIAQIMLARAMLGAARASGSVALRRFGLWQMALSVAPFCLGALNLVLKAVLDDPDRAENLIEWWVAAMMQGGLLVLALAWRASRFAWHGHASVARPG